MEGRDYATTIPMTNLKMDIERSLGVDVVKARNLCVGFGLVGLEASLADGRKVAVKAAKASDTGKTTLALEAFMLRELSRLTSLPVPEVLFGDDRLLIMAWVDTDGGGIGPAAQHHAARLLAELHAVPRLAFGYERDTVIGPLHQPNPVSDTWVPFFRDHRLFHMAQMALDAGKLPATVMHRIDRLAGCLAGFIEEPPHPSLIHGDLWTGNVLVAKGQIAGVIDPAIYCADREIELAFGTLFGTFGAPFFEAYEAMAPLEPGFHEVRCDLYNLYPLLVHLRLFGASYLGQVTTTLDKLGV